MLDLSPEEALNLGGLMQVKGGAVFLLKIPIRFRAGERLAGAVKGVGFEILVLSPGVGQRAGRICGRGDVRVGLRALVRKKLTGFWRPSTLDPSGDLSFLVGMK
jgi:hypothetical protein